MRRLTAGETAARLGVKPQTVYAYVSRGLLRRERGSHGSTFDPLEVEQFALGRDRTRVATSQALMTEGRPRAGPLMTIDTDVALIEDDELYYRGFPAAELARTATFEGVCRWLWTGTFEARSRFPVEPSALDRVRRALVALPGDAPLSDRLRVATPVLAGVDPLRDVIEPVSVGDRAAAMIANLARTVTGVAEGTLGVPANSGHETAALSAGDDAWCSIAAVLVDGLVPEPGSTERKSLIDCLNTALVLLIDHDLAASTLAVRAAASARANPYAVVISGLGALDSALHGNASRSAHRMLAQVADGRAAGHVIADLLTSGRGGVPGFGHRIYRGQDPRAEMIFEHLDAMPAASGAVAAAVQLCDVVGAHGAGFRNVDLGLAAMTLAFGMPDTAGELIFALARIGGWISHAIDEYGQPPLRLRPVGRYVGP